MDPNANLAEQLQLAADILKQCDNATDATGVTQDAERLAELVLALNEWLTNGGFIPQTWRERRW